MQKCGREGVPLIFSRPIRGERPRFNLLRGCTSAPKRSDPDPTVPDTFT
jgi:hypothetical protein